MSNILHPRQILHLHRAYGEDHLEGRVRDVGGLTLTQWRPPRGELVDWHPKRIINQQEMRI